MVSGDTSVSTEQRLLCARVAWLYYEGGLTQEQIGEALSLSRMRVSRLIAQARQIGVVRITIIPPPVPYFELQNTLSVRYGLRDVCVIQSPAIESARRGLLAAGAATWLEARLRPGLVVGVGLGRTTAMLARTFQPTECPTRFITVEGAGSVPTSEYAAYNVTSQLAAAAGGTVEAIAAPTFVADPEVRRFLLGEPSVRAALDLARRADIVIQSVGAVNADSTLVTHGTLSEVELQSLKADGAVGEALGHFFDGDGEPVRCRIDDHHIGLSLDDLRALDTSVVVAGGRDKVAPIRAGLVGGYFNVLITDEETGHRLMESI